ncbi:MAG: RnfABCDGE type electron transport complex subunit G [Prevotella sp.]|jgi:electron transport complex protein RnfG|nr:RnfABCDGE type electron transport complex subunit G [Prevotella sp.]MCI2081393.1 RnfABCDGE type electron transport complex subunit G [Prevotella sp.]MCI2101922.1 RnfABCDGE type electron transport complex subunit G [Prevotella sp.]
MKKLKSSLTNMVVVLVSCALVTGGLLAYVNHVTEGPIALQSEKTLADGIKTVMGGGNLRVTANDTVKQDMGGKTYLFVVHKTSQGGKEIGAAVESTTQGFGGDLKVLVGFDHQGTILGYTILSSSETPGLGAKAGQWFQKDGKGNIIGKSPSKGDLTVSKDGGDVDAITASTITSRAFLKAVNQAYHAYMRKAVDGHSGASQQVKKG